MIQCAQFFERMATLLCAGKFIDKSPDAIFHLPAVEEKYDREFLSPILKMNEGPDYGSWRVLF